MSTTEYPIPTPPCPPPRGWTFDPTVPVEQAEADLAEALAALTAIDDEDAAAEPSPSP